MNGSWMFTSFESRLPREDSRFFNARFCWIQAPDCIVVNVSMIITCVGLLELDRILGAESRRFERLDCRLSHLIRDAIAN